MDPDTHDIAIIGAGPLGLATALALARRGHHPCLFDARQADAEDTDARILALSHGSRDLLELLDAWEPSQGTSIARIEVSQQGGWGRTRILATDYRLPALGYVMKARQLVARLRNRVLAEGIPIEYDARTTLHGGSANSATFSVSSSAGNIHIHQARLVVCCEGAIPDGALALNHDYDQHALLCVATPDQPHHNLAHERFTPQGPIALLPHGSNYAVVWTVATAQADALMQAPESAWLEQLNAAIGPQTHLTELTERARYPLGLRMRREATGPRCVWLGNAAQTLHPVAGQGFNLALRDAWELADTLTGAADPGEAELLSAYARRRAPDREATIRFTDLLVRGFSAPPSPLLTDLRGLGLMMLDCMPPLRHFLAKRMIFGTRAWP
jgi:2-octaprenyl-6-methoxyphenol hydroxylase